MRVVFLNATGSLGGGERSLLDLIAAILAYTDDSGSSPFQATLILGSDGPCVETARALGIETEVFPLPPALAQWGDSGAAHGRLRRLATFAAQAVRLGWTARRFAQRLRARVLQLQPDVVHSNSIKTHLLSGLVHWPCPLVWHIRDYLGARPFVGRLSRWTSQRVAMAVTVSKSVAEDAARVLPGTPVEAIYDSIDTEGFAPGPRTDRIDELANLSPAPPGTLRVGLVAAYARWKGHLVFLEAAAKLLARQPSLPLRFYIVGGPIYATAGSQFSRAELEERAAALQLTQHVAFVPFQADIASVYRDLDIAVHASTKPEPFGRTIVEPQAVGLPVIVATTGGAAELVTPEENSLGVPPGDAEALANAMERLIVDPELAARLAAAGRSSALARFSRPRLGREIAALYQRLAADRTAR